MRDESVRRNGYNAFGMTRGDDKDRWDENATDLHTTRRRCHPEHSPSPASKPADADIDDTTSTELVFTIINGKLPNPWKESTADTPMQYNDMMYDMLLQLPCMQPGERILPADMHI